MIDLMLKIEVLGSKISSIPKTDENINGIVFLLPDLILVGFRDVDCLNVAFKYNGSSKWTVKKVDNDNSVNDVVISCFSFPLPFIKVLGFHYCNLIYNEGYILGWQG